MAKMANERKSWWQKRLGDGPWPVKKVATHDRPHFDEILSYVECATWGREIFPGIEKAKVEFLTEGKIPDEFKGKSADELLIKHKVLPIGIGEGSFDEHGTDSPTCAHLVAEVLGISDKPELQKILQFCKRVDDEGRSMPFDIHSLLNDRWDSCGSERELAGVFDWAVDAIRDYLRGQIKFFKCEAEFAEKGEILDGPVGVAIVESDNRKMNKWIRWKFGNRVSVIIQRRQTGNTAIFTTPNLNGINMTDLVRVVRMQELIKRGKVVPGWQKLEVAEECAECAFWYYSKKDKSQLLNGSFSAPDKEQTVQSLKILAGDVFLSCAPFSDPCKEEKCNGRQCDKYFWGFKQCRTKRFEIYHKKAA